MKLSSLKKNAIMNMIFTITNMAFPLITYPYVTRILHATAIGKVLFFSSISNYAVIIASLGITTYGIRVVASVRDNKVQLSKLSTELLLINIVMALFVVIFIVLTIPFVKQFNKELPLLIINMLLVITSPFGLTWLFSGLEQYSYIAKRNLIFKTISLIMVFIFVKKESDYTIYAMIIVFAVISSNLCNFCHSQKFVNFKLSKDLRFKYHLKPSLCLFVSLLAVSVYTCLDTIMLGFICGNDSVGYYSVASKIKWILLSVINAISAVLLPRLSNYLINKEEKMYNEVLRKSFSFIFILTIPLSLYFCLQAKDCIILLGGSSYTPSISCMQILMPILVFSGFSNITGNQILIPFGRDSYFMKAVIIGAVVDVILNCIFMPLLKEDGAALATLFAELTQMLFQIHYCKKEILQNIEVKIIIKVFIAVFISVTATVYLKTIIDINLIANLVITFVCFFSLYLFMLLIMKKVSLYS